MALAAAYGIRKSSVRVPAEREAGVTRRQAVYSDAKICPASAQRSGPAVRVAWQANNAVSTVPHLVCSNCGGSNTAAVIAAVIGGVTALITAGLAFATFKMARATAKASDAAGQEATATLDLVKLGEQQMRQAHLPVVMPVVEEVSVSESGQPGARVAIVAVPILNVGLGPALGITLRIEWLDENGNPSVAPQPMALPSPVAALGSGQRREMRARFRGLALPPLVFRVELEYGDTFGSGYRTTGRYFPEEGVVRDLEMEMLDAHGVVVTTIIAGPRA